jgi:uncharacterized protein YutE (UPF0331/DUF86 family)
MSTLGMYHDLQITNRDIYKNLGKVIEMIGFRNIAVHAYDDLNMSILEKILTNHLVDFEDFYRVVLSWVEGLEA